MSRILAVTNQKGGVGKTTTAINLGTALAAVRERVLIIDLDPQGNASTGLGIYKDQRETSSFDILMKEATIEDALLPVDVPGLDIIPSTLDLLGFENLVQQDGERALRLKNAIAHFQDKVASSSDLFAYDYILIDCPPSLNLLTINALAVADAVLVPLQCEFFALEGLGQLIETIEEVKQSLNPLLDVQGIVLTMYDSRNKLSTQVMADVKSYFGDKVYNTLIPRNVRVSEAPSHGKPVLLYDLNCAGSQAYIQLATEIILRERALRKAAGEV